MQRRIGSSISLSAFYRADLSFFHTVGVIGFGEKVIRGRVCILFFRLIAFSILDVYTRMGNLKKRRAVFVGEEESPGHSVKINARVGKFYT